MYNPDNYLSQAGGTFFVCLCLNFRRYWLIFKDPIENQDSVFTHEYFCTSFVVYSHKIYIMKTLNVNLPWSLNHICCLLFLFYFKKCTYMYIEKKLMENPNRNIWLIKNSWKNGMTIIKLKCIIIWILNI